MKPVPLLIFALCIATSCFAQETDPFAGDTRLLKKHTIKAAGIPLKELLEDLTKQTEIQFTAGHRVAEDKVVLFAHDRPLADSLRIIAKFFNFYWGRSGNPGGYSYLLSQSLRQQKAEEAEIEGEYLRAADQILDQARMMADLSRRDPEELKQLAEDLRAEGQAEKDSEKRRELMGRAAMAALLGRSPYKAHAAKLLASFGKEGVLRILHGESVEYAYPARPGKSPLPEPIAESIMSGVKAEKSRADREYNIASLGIRGSQGSRPQIHVSIQAGGRTASSGTGFTMPNDSESGLSAATPPVEPDGWRDIPVLKRFVSFTVPRREPWTETDKGKLPAPFLARALAALEQEAPLDLIGDAFYRTPRIPLNVQKSPIGEALTTICRNAEHRWRYNAGFVQVKDTGYAEARAAEPSIFRLRFWAALSDDSLLSLDRLSEIASQTIPRFQTSMYVLAEARGMEQWHEILPARSHLLFWNSLSMAQRSAALSTNGLAFRKLTGSQKNMFAHVSMNPGYREDAFSTATQPEWTEETLANASLIVTRQVQPMWGTRGSDGSMYASGSPTREMALMNLRRNNQPFSDSAVWDIQKPTYRFRYGVPDGIGATALIQLPSIWSKPKAKSDAGERKAERNP